MHEEALLRLSSFKKQVCNVELMNPTNEELANDYDKLIYQFGSNSKRPRKSVRDEQKKIIASIEYSIKDYFVDNESLEKMPAEGLREQTRGILELRLQRGFAGAKDALYTMRAEDIRLGTYRTGKGTKSLGDE